jgi:hypothetical protein
MTLTKLEKIINKMEGAGTYALDTPLAFHNISAIVNSFDWSGTLVRYDKCRVVFKASGLYYVIPVAESQTLPTGDIDVDYDIVGGRYWIYMKPRGNLAYDILSVAGIGSVKLYPKFIGGTV